MFLGVLSRFLKYFLYCLTPYDVLTPTRRVYLSAFQHLCHGLASLISRDPPILCSMQKFYTQLSRQSNAIFGCLPLTRGCGLYESRESVEDSPYLARVFESVLAAATFCLVPLHLPKPQRGKNVAGARHAPTDGFDNLTGAHLFVFSEY